MTGVAKRLHIVDTVVHTERNGGTMPWQANGGHPIAVYGFRTTFRIWHEEGSSTLRAMSKAALAHAAKSKAEAACNHTGHFENAVS